VSLFKGGQEVLVFNVATQNADPASVANTEGRITDKQSPAEQRKRLGIPENVDPAEWERRMDQVRNAAREFDPQELEDIKEWLQGKTNRDLSEEEIQDFLNDVKRHRLSDLVDVLDQSIRRRVALRARGRRTVRVVPPRGWVRRTMQNLEDSDIVELHRRLRSRGFSDEELEAHLIKRYPDDRQAKLKARI
jgi:predicted house-cleaning noncanonical NTP pyrophosphatase (MazG superfamily)